MRILPYFFLLTVATLVSCETNPLKQVDVSDSPVEITFERFDREVFGADFSQPAAAGQQLYRKYGDFYCDYIEYILQAAPCQPDSNFGALQGFVTFQNMVAIYQDIQKKFPDEKIQTINASFTDALKRYHHFFPKEILPRVVYMHSGLNFSAFSTDSIIAVGLDFYLGPEDSLVQLFPFPLYFKEDMREDYLVVNSIKDFCWAYCNEKDSLRLEKDLLSSMIHHGKVMYMMDALMPEAADSTKMNWSATQYAWAENAYYNIWMALANEKVLFGTKPVDNKKWVDYGPFTNAPGIPQESPPQLGIWIGWKMVRDYAAAHPDLSVEQLIAQSDPQAFLTAFKKPRKP